MEDLAFYNQGCKALSLLITIFAKVVIYRLLTFGPLGLLSVCVCMCVCTCVCACVCDTSYSKRVLELVIDI